MIRGKLLEKFAGTILAGAITIAVSIVGAYIAVTKAQANHETRISTIEDKQKDAPAAIEKAEERINRRLDSIQTDVREIRNAQMESLQRK